MAAPRLPPEKVEEVKAVYAECHNVRATARRTNVSHSTVSDIVMRIRDGAPAPKPKTPEDKLREAEERRDRERELRREKELMESLAGEKSFRAFLANLFRDAVKPLPPPKPPKPPKKSKGKIERYPLLHLSDFHFEEIVKAEAVMGLNSYDIPTACRRAYRVVHAFLDWHRDLLASGRFITPELVVSLNGDMLTGTLHGLERHSGSPNIIRSAIACGRLLGLILRDLAAAFPKVRVYGTVGNHGRLPDDKKVPTKDPTRSWDYLAYAWAAQMVSGCKNVTVELPESYGCVTQVGGHTCYFGHGNFVKQQLGIVGYGMRRFVSNMAANLGAAGRPLSYAFFGHFHSRNMSEFAGVTAFIGPSLIGTQEYGFLGSGSVNRPAQLAFLFDRELGQIGMETLYGDGPGYEGTYEVAV